MQVVDSALIEDVAAEDMGDLNGFVPGLVVSGDSPTQPRYQIRGIQTGDFGVGTDPAVGVYVDGIYAARSGASMLAFNDIERIEVLKGPQGTLFGRNSAAGAISIITAPAVERVRLACCACASASSASSTTKACSTRPSASTSRCASTVSTTRATAGCRTRPPARTSTPEENWAGRAALRWDLSDATSATLSWDHDDLDQLARPAIGLVAVDGPARSPYPADAATYLDPRKAPIYNDVVGNEESRKLDQANLFIDHAFGFGGLPLQHLVAPVRHREPRGRGRHEPDQHVLRHGEHRETTRASTRSSSSPAKPTAIDWVAGVSYYNEKADQVSDTQTYTDSVDTLGMNLGIYEANGIPFPLYGFTSSVIEPFGVTMLGLPWREAMYNRGDFEAYAAFGDVIWHVNDKTNLTLGLRYTQDKKEFTWINGPHETPELDAVVAGLEAGGLLRRNSRFRQRRIASRTSRSRATRLSAA